MKFSTIAIRSGQSPDPTTGAINFPIYQTSTYAQEAPSKHKGFSYSRTENPTRHALEKNIAALENSEYGLCFASGLAAINTVLNLLETGAHVIAPDDIYGGTYRIFTQVYKKYGIDFTFVDQTKPENVKKAVQPNTKIVWIETPSNPLLKIADIKELSRLSSEHGCLSVVDNTFASPYLQQPLSLGTDIVIHSTTKYLGGHSDVIGGALVTKSQELYNQLRFYQNAVGTVPGPQDCFLVLRGIKTLSLRLEKHCANAKAITAFLKEHDKVNKVFYPVLPTHDGHLVAKKQMKDYGAIVSFELNSDWEGALAFSTSVKLFNLAESLGTVVSLVNHPASMTHASIPQHVREANGITNGLFRLSVGCEDVEDLIEDLQQALAKVDKKETKKENILEQKAPLAY
ncbi:trans-sulfuration enzyme family protein [Acidobacteriota bacterium]